MPEKQMMISIKVEKKKNMSEQKIEWLNIYFQLMHFCFILLFL
jgi:hypothetical protein